MRLFISYARIDKPYCVRVVDVLNAHELWYDQRLYAGQNWWMEILRRLEWCDAFVFLLSADSIESDYCKREFEVAQSLSKPIIPILIRMDITIPDYLNEIQYIDISDGLTVEAVKTLLNTIFFIQEETYKTRVRIKPRQSNSITVLEDEEGDLIARAVEAMKNGNYDQAVFLLNRCKDLGITSSYINADALLKEAEHGLNDLMQQHEVQRNYEQIRQLLTFENTKRLGLEAFQRFRDEHPNYDPENFSNTFKEYLTDQKKYVQSPAGQSKGHLNGNGHTKEKVTKPFNAPGQPSTASPHREIKGVIQPEWCKIPAGMVRVDSDPHSHVYVDEFYISKFPITNAHYHAFLKDPKGYNNISWWDFSGAATQCRLQHTAPPEPMFKGANRPRENVTWYDAVAFCRWLSSKYKRVISLPTLEQRQRAIQGNDDRIYPWGNDFNLDFCNSHESELRMTTTVNRYEEGVSPYGVYDLIGNVWEWCYDDTLDEGDDSSLETAKKRIVHGGSYLSGGERCHINFRYVLPAQTIYSSIGFRIVLLPD